MSTAVEAKDRILESLRGIWEEIQQRWPEVPSVEIRWATERRRTSLPQHLHAGEWSGELVAADEQAAAGAKALVLALLHEAVHGVAAVRGISVSSRHGRYHNTRFKQLAEDAFEFAVDENYAVGWGWSETKPPNAVVEAYLDSSHGRELADAVEVFRAGTKPPGTPRSQNLVVAVCGCAGDAARPIRIWATKLTLGPITCGICGQDYTPRD